MQGPELDREALALLGSFIRSKGAHNLLQLSVVIIPTESGDASAARYTIGPPFSSHHTCDLRGWTFSAHTLCSVVVQHEDSGLL